MAVTILSYYIGAIAHIIIELPAANLQKIWDKKFNAPKKQEVQAEKMKIELNSKLLAFLGLYNDVSFIPDNAKKDADDGKDNAVELEETVVEKLTTK